MTQMIHDLCRSKHLITVLNRLNLCTSYESMERIDTSLTQRVIDLADGHRVPVPPQIQSESIIHGAMDNFDDGPSHDTILMLFQNQSNMDNSDTVSISLNENPTRSRKLVKTLGCQNLVPCFRGKARGTIPTDFRAVTELPELIHGQYSDDLWRWSFLRYQVSTRCQSVNTNVQWVPSFSAIKSILSDDQVRKSCVAFTPILPFPATDYDAIFTSMLNFQDVLAQKRQLNGALWCDEGVYHIAKELQLLNSTKFKNIFLGLGGFHMEKVLLKSIGQYLSKAGVRNIFVQTELYGSGVTDGKIMTGGHYVLSQEAFRILYEAVSRLRLSKFEEQDTAATMNYNQLISVANKDALTFNENEIRQRWYITGEHEEYDKFRDRFGQFVSKGSIASENFKYWNVFLDIIMPTFTDLMQSFQQGHWDMHLSALRRAVVLFFAFGHINYNRWTPVYYEECLKLPLLFPNLHASFISEGFVAHHTTRKGSGVPFDQALESAYNKPAKGPGGVIGISRKKEAVLKWNLIKHEKAKYTRFINDICNYVEKDEYSLHHEFSTITTTKDEQSVPTVCGFFRKRGDIFAGENLTNFVTGEVLDASTKEFFLGCIDRGDKLYNDFRDTQIVKKTSALLDRISKAGIPKAKSGKYRQKERNHGFATNC